MTKDLIQYATKRQIKGIKRLRIEGISLDVPPKEVDNQVFDLLLKAKISPETFENIVLNVL